MVLPVERRWSSVASLTRWASPPEIVAPQLSGLRVFAGNCGWQPGQLDVELADGWWVRAEPEIADLFDADPETLWARVLARQPMPTCLLASFPDDPTLN